MRTQSGSKVPAETLTRSIDAYMQDTRRVLAATPRDAILVTVRLLYRAWEQARQVFVLGNGGSASTSSHIANDLSKATIVPGMPRMRVFSLSDNVALLTAWANDTSYDAVFKEQLENLLELGDTVLAISASGNSPNVLRALEFARQRGAVTAGWTGASGGRLKELVDVCVQVPTEDVGMIESVHLVIDHLVTKQLCSCIQACSVNRSAGRPVDEQTMAAVSSLLSLPTHALELSGSPGAQRRQASRPRLRAGAGSTTL